MTTNTNTSKFVVRDTEFPTFNVRNMELPSLEFQTKGFTHDDGHTFAVAYVHSTTSVRVTDDRTRRQYVTIEATTNEGFNLEVTLFGVTIDDLFAAVVAARVAEGEVK